MTNVVSVKYGAPSAVRRWFDEYWTEKNKSAASWLTFAIMVGFIFLGLQLLLFVVSLFPLDQLGNSGASITAHTILVVFASILALLAAIALFRQICKPSAIEIADEYMRLKWPFALRGAKLKWSDIAKISIHREPNKIDSRSYVLRFSTSEEPVRLSLRLGELETVPTAGSID